MTELCWSVIHVVASQRNSEVQVPVLATKNHIVKYLLRYAFSYILRWTLMKGENKIEIFIKKKSNLVCFKFVNTS